MNYKALIFDLDGTAIPNKPEGMPSNALVDAVKKLHERKIHVSAATGRPFFNSKPIIRKLTLTDPCIISGGTQIVDPVSGKIVWEKDMSRWHVQEIIHIASPYSYGVYFSDDEVKAPAKDKKITGPERIIYIMAVNAEDTLVILQKLETLPNIVSHKVTSWTKGHFDIHITHAEATKRHALEILLEKLHVHKDEVIAVGDSNNDLPLLEMAGLKVAMGNGTEDLKKIADHIAPSVDQDGLAKVIKKFLLRTES